MAKGKTVVNVVVLLVAVAFIVFLAYVAYSVISSKSSVGATTSAESIAREPTVYAKQSTLQRFVDLAFTGDKGIVNRVKHYEPYAYLAVRNAEFFRTYDVRNSGDEANELVIKPKSAANNQALVLTSGIMLNKNYRLKQEDMDAHYAQNEPENRSAARHWKKLWQQQRRRTSTNGLRQDIEAVKYLDGKCNVSAMVGLPFVDVRDPAFGVDVRAFYGNAEAYLCTCSRHNSYIIIPPTKDFTNSPTIRVQKPTWPDYAATAALPFNGQRTLRVREPQTTDSEGNSFFVKNSVFAIDEQLALINNDPCYGLQDGTYAVDDIVVRMNDVSVLMNKNAELAAPCRVAHKNPASIRCEKCRTVELIPPED